MAEGTGVSCSICVRIPPSSTASVGSSLPDAAALLKPRSGAYPEMGGAVDLSACPECGRWYVYTTYMGADEYMYGHARETLDRLTAEQSDVVDAMLGCQAEPAAIEHAWFALPVNAFNHVLAAAYAKDRDFIALFVPRLVHAAATRSHATHSVLFALVDQNPSYAREVLAAIASLPAELREPLHELEERCRECAVSAEWP